MVNVPYQEYWRNVYQNQIKFPCKKDGTVIPWEIKTHDKNLEKILKQYNIKPKDALELGCGEGYDSNFLHSQGFNVTAIDISEKVIEKARLTHSDKIKFLAIDFLKDLIDNKFDLIFDRGFLHNYKSQLAEIFLKLSSITKENAKIILIVGNPNTPILDTCMPSTVTISEIEFFSMNWFKIIHVEEIEFEVNENYQSSLGYIFLLEKRQYPLNY